MIIDEFNLSKYAKLDLKEKIAYVYSNLNNVKVINSLLAYQNKIINEQNKKTNLEITSNRPLYDKEHCEYNTNTCSQYAVIHNLNSINRYTENKKRIVCISRNDSRKYKKQKYTNIYDLNLDQIFDKYLLNTDDGNITKNTLFNEIKVLEKDISYYLSYTVLPEKLTFDLMLNECDPPTITNLYGQNTKSHIKKNSLNKLTTVKTLDLSNCPNNIY